MSSAVIPAIITASVAVIGVVLTQVATLLRDRSERAYARRRAALVDAQDAALELRHAVRRYGRALRAGHTSSTAPPGTIALSVPDELADALNAALGRLQVRASRVDDATTVALLRTWQQRAQANAISSQDVSASGEQAAFDALIAAIGAALRSPKGRTSTTGAGM